MTAMGRIGGHRGLDVVREHDGLTAGPNPPTVITKTPLHDMGNQGELAGVDLWGMNVSAVHNEAVMLCEMEDSGYTPRLIDVESDHVSFQEDLGHSEVPLDAEVWRQNLVRMLATIRSRGLRHGDLRGSNIITRGNHPWAIDWQEGHYIGDVPPQKSPYSDSQHLMQHIIGTIGRTGVADVPRVARRWGAILGVMGATTDLTLPLANKVFVDFGCFQGDFVALAASEGMNALGIDRGGFRTGEDSIAIAQDLWAGFPFGHTRFIKRDIVEWGNYACDVAMMFSTWSYIVQDFGQNRAEELLHQIITEAGVFFFENQLAGDGPGPAFLQSDEDIRAMMFRLGAVAVRPIGTFPVTGRPASRTVWQVQR